MEHCRCPGGSPLGPLLIQILAGLVGAAYMEEVQWGRRCPTFQSLRCLHPAVTNAYLALSNTANSASPIFGESFFTAVIVSFTQEMVLGGKEISRPRAAVSGSGFCNSIVLPSLNSNLPPVT